jgi:hypothetical protein
VKTFLVAMALATIANADEKKPNWHESMREMAVTLTELIPDLTRPEVFLSADDKTKIISRSKSFLKFAHAVKDNPNPPSRDPIVPMIGNNLKADLETAIAKLEAGKWSQGARQMLNLTNNCIACHTLTQGPATAAVNSKLEHFSPLQKANFYAATRQFDRAIINYEYTLTDAKWAKDHEKEWNDAFQKLLAISVRARNSPDLTLELLSRFFDSKTYPQSLNTAARTWREHTKEWSREKSSKDSLKAASHLVERANQLQAKNKEPVALVLYLRASSILHGILSRPEQEKNQEALLLAGQAAEGLSERNFWTYSDFYFRQCFAANPNSPIGMTCGGLIAK